MTHEDQPRVASQSEPTITPDAHEETSLQQAAQGLATAREQGPEVLASFLNSLSGKAVLSVKGAVFTPRLTRAFGDWIILPPEAPNQGQFELTGGETIDTNDEWPYVRGRIAFLSGRSFVQPDGRVVLIAEQYVEDGEPRIMFPLELEKFQIIKLRKADAFTQRELEHDLTVAYGHPRKA